MLIGNRPVTVSRVCFLLALIAFIVAFLIAAAWVTAAGNAQVVWIVAGDVFLAAGFLTI